MRGSLSPPEPISQTIFRLVQPFLHSSPQSVPILYDGQLLPHSKVPLSHKGSGSPSNTWFLGSTSTEVLNPNSISIGSAVFAGLTTVTDRQTDRQTTLLGSVTIDRIYVRSILRCGLKNTYLVRIARHSASASMCNTKV